MQRFKTVFRRAGLAALMLSLMLTGCNKNTTEEPSTDSQRETTEETEEITRQTTEEATTEAPKNDQSLDIIKLNAFSEDGDGADTISGHIQSIVKLEGRLIILSDDGHLYSYYTDSGRGYVIYDLGKPDWDITDISKASAVSNDYYGETSENLFIEGNRYYYAELKKGEAVCTISGTILEGQEISEIYIHNAMMDVYAADGKQYETHRDENRSETRTHVDSENFWSYLEGETANPDVVFPEGLSLINRFKDCYLLSNGKLYYGASMGTPIEDTANYTFTKLCGSAGLYEFTGITDTNELLIMEANNNSKSSNTLLSLSAIPLPEVEILELWYTNGEIGSNSVFILKTSDGYYSYVPAEGTGFEPDETFNALTKEVVAVCGQYVLLDDGYVYELPRY
ncbi:MAG: hypothetical protein NC089_02380 [Bacteroides sp.]|nr:hypothetical protein [Bacteroides sp.]MCM1550132.1 hypothetical protein [Clostridium sp.]